MSVECSTCHVHRVVTVTETFVVFGKRITVTLCMRCWLEERQAER